MGITLVSPARSTLRRLGEIIGARGGMYGWRLTTLLGTTGPTGGLAAGIGPPGGPVAPVLSSGSTKYPVSGGTLPAEPGGEISQQLGVFRV